MEKVYWSNKNYMFKSNEFGWLLYSGLTNSFFRLDEEAKEKIDCFLENGKPLPPDFEEVFLRKGVLLKYSEDFLRKEYQYNCLKAQFESDTLFLTIAPTMACNFNCIYCFEEGKRHGRKMSSEIMEKLLDFVLSTKYKKIAITWYGGEPLLAIDTIKDIYTRFTSAGLELTQNIITNGYLLTPDTIKILHSIELKSMQITIDGAKETHDSRRKLLNGESTYETIIKNLEYLYNYANQNDYKIDVVIRVNIDKGNVDDYSVVKNYFTEHFGKFYSVYYSVVTETNTCMDKTDSFTPAMEKDFILSLYGKPGFDEVKLFPEQMTNFYCSAQLFNSYVIDPVGNMYKCLEDIGDKTRIVGSICDSSVRNEELKKKYTLESLFYLPLKCQKCFFMYLCKGGCPNKRIFGTQKCPIYREEVNNFLEKQYQYARIHKK